MQYATLNVDDIKLLVQARDLLESIAVHSGGDIMAFGQASDMVRNALSHVALSPNAPSYMPEGDVAL